MGPHRRHVRADAFILAVPQITLFVATGPNWAAIQPLAVSMEDHVPRNDGGLSLKRGVIAAGICVLAGWSAYAEPVELGDETLKQTVAGKTVNLDTPFGVSIPITYHGNGLMSGKAGVLEYFLGAEADRGRWWVANGKLCQKWFKWLDAQPSCMQLKQDGDKILWRRDDGLSGTATIASAFRLAPARRRMGSAARSNRRSSGPSLAADPPETGEDRIRKHRRISTAASSGVEGGSANGSRRDRAAPLDDRLRGRHRAEPTFHIGTDGPVIRPGPHCESLVPLNGAVPKLRRTLHLSSSSSRAFLMPAADCRSPPNACLAPSRPPAFAEMGSTRAEAKPTGLKSAPQARGRSNTLLSTKCADNPRKNTGEYILTKLRTACCVLAIGTALCLAGCGAAARLDALPSGTGAVAFLRIDNARFDGDDGEALKQEIWQSLTREWPRLSNNLLALSGGQEDGAFGAGLLVGWSERGDRPEFKIVTGTSTGALAAPFAFLGSEYDWALKKIYTETQACRCRLEQALPAVGGEQRSPDGQRAAGAIDRQVPGHRHPRSHRRGVREGPAAPDLDHQSRHRQARPSGTSARSPPAVIRDAWTSCARSCSPRRQYRACSRQS